MTYMYLKLMKKRLPSGGLGREWGEGRAWAELKTQPGFHVTYLDEKEVSLRIREGDLG